MYTELVNIEKHLADISKADWRSLFDFIGQLQKQNGFGKWDEGSVMDGIGLIPSMKPDEIVTRIYSRLHELRILVVFDWMKWDEGNAALSDKDFNFESFDLISLCKLLTVIERRDRFSEGFLVRKFEDGTVLKIFKAIKNRAAQQ